MKKAIILSIVVCWIFVPGLAMSQSNSSPNTWTGNVNFFLGGKILDDDDWEPLEEHFEGSILLDFKQKNWPASIAIDFLIGCLCLSKASKKTNKFYPVKLIRISLPGVKSEDEKPIIKSGR